jgi:predicted kinase
MPQNNFYILTGMSFAGKSVLGRAIAKRKGIDVIDPDMVRIEMGLGLDGEFLSAEVWATIHAEAEARARVILKAGHSLVYDTTAFDKGQRDELRDLARQSGAEPVVIAVKIDRDDAYRRWKRNNETLERFTVHIDDFNMCAEAFKYPHGEPHIVYETGQDLDTWITNNL